MAEAKGALEPLARAAEEARDALRRATQMQERARAESHRPPSAGRPWPASSRRSRRSWRAPRSRAIMRPCRHARGRFGLERAVSAVLGERLRASIVGSVEGLQRLSGADGAARALISSNERRASEPPKEGARPLLDLVEARGDAGPITERLLADAWLVDEIEARRGLCGGRGHRRRGVLRRGRRRGPAFPKEGNGPGARGALRARGARLAPRSASRLRNGPGTIWSAPIDARRGPDPRGRGAACPAGCPARA